MGARVIKTGENTDFGYPKPSDIEGAPENSMLSLVFTVNIIMLIIP